MTRLTRRSTKPGTSTLYLVAASHGDITRSTRLGPRTLSCEPRPCLPPRLTAPPTDTPNRHTYRHAYDHAYRYA